VREVKLKTVVEDQKAELTDAHNDAEILIDSMSSVLISLDEHGIVSKWNSVATNMFGIPLQEAVGTKLQSLPIAWASWSDVEAAIQDCEVVQRNRAELKFVDRDGFLRTLDATICPILNDRTSKARLFLANDITKQKALQTQLDQALRLESVGQLAAGVAHEINTPMQYIGDNVRFVARSIQKLDPFLDCLHMLADPEITDDQLCEIRKQLPDTIKPSKIKSSLEQIPDALTDSIDGVVTVSKIVAAMKEFSHPGSDEKSQVCLNHVLESTITVAKNEWKYVADVVMDFEEDLCKVEGLPSELNQAFLNIIVNASHAISDRVNSKELAKGLIKIATRSMDDHVLITIQDDGGGIPLHARNKVFEPFFTTKEVGKGTGQGLAIAFVVIAQKHGGKLSFTVEEGVGTTFQIKIPKVAIAHESESFQETVGA
jgi:PAS domain S-box-containing protein